MLPFRDDRLVAARRFEKGERPCSALYCFCSVPLCCSGCWGVRAVIAIMTTIIGVIVTIVMIAAIGSAKKPGVRPYVGKRPGKRRIYVANARVITGGDIRAIAVFNGKPP